MNDLLKWKAKSGLSYRRIAKQIRLKHAKVHRQMTGIGPMSAKDAIAYQKLTDISLDRICRVYRKR